MISIYPDVVPNDVTIWEAAAPDSSLSFMLVGAAVLLPIILAYTGHAYWVFRGKVGTRDTIEARRQSRKCATRAAHRLDGPHLGHQRRRARSS